MHLYFLKHISKNIDRKYILANIFCATFLYIFKYIFEQ